VDSAGDNRDIHFFLDHRGDPVGPLVKIRHHRNAYQAGLIGFQTPDKFLLRIKPAAQSGDTDHIIIEQLGIHEQFNFMAVLFKDSRNILYPQLLG